MEKGESGPKNLNTIYGKYLIETMSETERQAFKDPLVASVSEAVGKKVTEEIEKQDNENVSPWENNELFVYDDIPVPRPGITVKWILDHLREQGKLKE